MAYDRHSFEWISKTAKNGYCGLHDAKGCFGKVMSDEELKAELERLRQENAALKKGAAAGIRMKVSEKGAVSILRHGPLPRNLV